MLYKVTHKVGDFNVRYTRLLINWETSMHII